MVPSVREAIGGLPVMGLDKPRSEVAGPFRPHKMAAGPSSLANSSNRSPLRRVHNLRLQAESEVVLTPASQPRRVLGMSGIFRPIRIGEYVVYLQFVPDGEDCMRRSLIQRLLGWVAVPGI